MAKINNSSFQISNISRHRGLSKILSNTKLISHNSSRWSTNSRIIRIRQLKTSSNNNSKLNRNLNTSRILRSNICSRIIIINLKSSSLNTNIHNNSSNILPKLFNRTRSNNYSCNSLIRSHNSRCFRNKSNISNSSSCLSTRIRSSRPNSPRLSHNLSRNNFNNLNFRFNNNLQSQNTLAKNLNLNLAKLYKYNKNESWPIRICKRNNS